MDSLQAIIIAIVEGITEFLPISSTAHMIFTSTFFGIEEDSFVKMYQIAIQLGAILSVVFLYPKRFFRKDFFSFYLKLAVGVLPALLIGYFLGDYIETALEKPLIVAIVLVLGGVFLLFIDTIFSSSTSKHQDSEVSYLNMLWVGFWQCMAMMPGVSRSAATIIGGMQQKFSRNLAAEFSFFLAVPTMLAATLYALILKKWDYQGIQQKGYEMIFATPANLQHFIVGNIVAFIVAMIAIKTFIGLLKKYGFRIWGWYRIIAGIGLILLFSLN